MRSRSTPRLRATQRKTGREISSAGDTAETRHGGIDALRGLAMVWMTIYHLCFDLQHSGYLDADFHRDPFWTVQRTAIVALFLLCAGIGQASSRAAVRKWGQFWQRWGQIAACAVLVTLASYVMYPRSFIYFGVLHGMAAMLIVARLTARWGVWLWPAGTLAMGLPYAARLAHAAWPGLELLDGPMLNWLGLISRKPITEDYVPLFPWLGVMWWGLALGAWIRVRAPQVLNFGDRLPSLAPLRMLGRWSLSYYMLHQPVLIGTLMLVSLARAH